MKTKRYIPYGCLLLFCVCTTCTNADVLILTSDQAATAPSIQIQPDGAIKADGVANLTLNDISLIRFDPLPCDAGRRAWLCFRSGQRVSGKSIVVGPDRVTLTMMQGQPIPAALAELQAVFFLAGRPTMDSLPDSGVRIISPNGDVMNAPAAELTETGVIVDISPDVDPILLPLSRVAGVLWPDSTAPKQGLFVELRTGERFAGQILSLNEQSLTLKTGEMQQAIPTREISEIVREPQRRWRLDQCVMPPVASGDRPKYRIGRNALGGTLAVGSRLYKHGLGCRGPMKVEVKVPAGAKKWFLADVGVDNAAPFARVNVAIVINEQTVLNQSDLEPGDVPRRIAVSVKGVDVITLKVEPAAESPVGCLGDIVDAMFIE